jgi:hypothetical protein
MATARGIDPFLKAALPTRILKRHGQSLHQRAPGSPLRHGGWVPHVMQADQKRKKPNHCARSRRRATTPRLRTLSASSHPVGQREGLGPHVMQQAQRLMRARKPHHHSHQCRISSTAEPVP